jgi:hypothetical protein
MSRSTFAPLASLTTKDPKEIRRSLVYLWVNVSRTRLLEEEEGREKTDRAEEGKERKGGEEGEWEKGEVEGEGRWGGNQK